MRKGCSDIFTSLKPVFHLIQFYLQTCDMSMLELHSSYNNSIFTDPCTADFTGSGASHDMSSGIKARDLSHSFRLPQAFARPKDKYKLRQQALSPRTLIMPSTAFPPGFLFNPQAFSPQVSHLKTI